MFFLLLIVFSHHSGVVLEIIYVNRRGERVLLAGFGENWVL